MLHLWYKEAIIYALDVETFFDSNGDGIGDFPGLTQRLDYLSGLGVTCLWLLPFYGTPNRDNGYDVSDFYTVDPRLGTLGDFVEFVQRAEMRGMRVIVDLVVNHTSNEHPWFQAARCDPKSKYRDFYVWSKEQPKDAHKGMVFPGEQETTWTYDDVAGEYYFHRFYDFQPDLNIANPEVRAEISKIIGFWLQLGVSGFRADALPFVLEQVELDDALREFRQYLSWHRGDAIFLAEANVPRDQIDDYFDHGTKIQMIFNFLVNQPLFLALARKEAGPLVDAVRNLPLPSFTCAWANFLRNHDELDLGRLGKSERDEVFQVFGPDESMQLYDRGIRRRLSPMFGGDERRLRMAYSLMFSLPGTPVLRYGEEIGMGDDLSLEGRDAVRTPMQWTDEPNAGFSTVRESKLPRPVIAEGKYRYEEVNVAAQQRDSDSLLNWMEHLIRVRKECYEFGTGEWTVLDVDAPAVFAHRCEDRDGAVIALHNLSDRPATVEIGPDEQPGRRFIELWGTQRHTRIEHRQRVELEPYGYRWYRVSGAGLKHA